MARAIEPKPPRVVVVVDEAFRLVLVLLPEENLKLWLDREELLLQGTGWANSLKHWRG